MDWRDKLILAGLIAFVVGGAILAFYMMNHGWSSHRTGPGWNGIP